MRTIIFFFLISFKILAQDSTKIKIVKPKAQCSATLLGRTGGTITVNELKTCNAISVSGPCDYKVTSFLFSCNFKGRLFEVSTKAESFPAVIKNFLMSLTPGEKFFIEKIKVKSSLSGQIFSLPDLKFKIIP